MNRGEFLTRLTIWLALGAYATGAGMMLLAKGRASRLAQARNVWTLGCALFLAHVACAFSFFYHWSHATALQETARQAGELVGWPWEDGLYFNYLFAIAWVADVLWWWFAPESFARRSPRLNAIWHGFFFLMVLNGAVVFVKGPMRWAGLLFCGGLAALWWWTRRRAIAVHPPAA